MSLALATALDSLSALDRLAVAPATLDDSALIALFGAVADEMARRGIGAPFVPPGMNHLGPMLLAHLAAQRTRLGLESAAIVFLSTRWLDRPTLGLSISPEAGDDPARRGFLAADLPTVLRGLGAMPASAPATLAAE